MCISLIKSTKGPLSGCSLGCTTVRMHKHLEIPTGFSVPGLVTRCYLICPADIKITSKFQFIVSSFPQNPKRSRTVVNQEKTGILQS